MSIGELIDPEQELKSEVGDEVLARIEEKQKEYQNGKTKLMLAQEFAFLRPMLDLTARNRYKK